MEKTQPNSDFWPSAVERAGESPEDFRKLPLADRMSALARNYLVTRSRHTRFFSGVDLSRDSGCQDLLAAVDTLSYRMFG